jgi:hypothetical protein
MNTTQEIAEVRVAAMGKIEEQEVAHEREKFHWHRKERAYQEEIAMLRALIAAKTEFKIEERPWTRYRSA